MVLSHYRSLLIALTSICAIANAQPTHSAPPTQTFVKRATCTPSSGGSESIDDVPAISSAISSCGNGGTVVLPAESTYYANSVLSFAGCKGCQFQIEGLLKFSDSTSYWNGKIAMIYLDNISGATITSVTGSGVIDGNGQDAWDLFASNSSFARPTLLYITGGSDITVSNLRQKNPPNVFNSVNGNAVNVLFSSLTMDATSKSSNPPKNTDGFDIGASTYVTVSNVNVLNDDDCVAFKPGANLSTVNAITCTGSHGISVGSLGASSSDAVSNIYVVNAAMFDSTKAAGIKTYPSGGGHGLSTITNITFDNFTVTGGDYAFQVQSCYGEDASYCAIYPGDAQINNVVVKGFNGITSSVYDPVTANIDCGANGNCGIVISDWTIKTPSGADEVLCSNTLSTLGVSCTSGASG